jgi:hypothetical protein
MASCIATSEQVEESEREREKKGTKIFLRSRYGRVSSTKAKQLRAHILLHIFQHHDLKHYRG